MANLTFEYFEIDRIDEQIEVWGGETVASRRGKFMRIDATTGKALLGNASSAGEVGVIHGIAMSSEKYVGDKFTLLQRGLVDVGDALDGMDYGDPIYLSDDDGTFADTAGTVSTVAGYVYPVVKGGGTVDKLFFVTLEL